MKKTKRGSGCGSGAQYRLMSAMVSQDKTSHREKLELTVSLGEAVGHSWAAPHCLYISLSFSFLLYVCVLASLMFYLISSSSTYFYLRFLWTERVMLCLGNDKIDVFRPGSLALSLCDTPACSRNNNISVYASPQATGCIYTHQEITSHFSLYVCYEFTFVLDYVDK